MPIRLAGMSSGLDTDSIVKALMSSYNLQKDNLVKAQTKLSWKQDSWKTMNKSIYSFYTGSLKNSQYSSTYRLKKSSVSSTGYANVTASSNAVDGNQTLEVKQLASTGYLTGGKISAQDSSKTLSGSSKLSEVKGLEGMQDSQISVTVDGNQKTIKLTADSTINEFIVGLKEAGLSANFDENNQRFFISAAKSGADHDFSINGNDSTSQTVISKLGLFTSKSTTKDADGNEVDSPEVKEYKKWTGYFDDATRAAAVEEYCKANKITYADKAKEYADAYNKAYDIIDTIKTENNVSSKDELEKNLAEKKEKLLSNDKYKDCIKTDDSSNLMTDANGNYIFDDDKIKALSADEQSEITELKNNITGLTSAVKAYSDAQSTMDTYKDRVHIADDSDGHASAVTESDPEYSALKTDVDKQKEGIDTQFLNKASEAQKMLANLSSLESSGAVRIAGQDSTIILNGAEFTSNTNNYSINGLTIEATAITDKAVTITTNTDTDAIYNQIKSFLKDYNALIKEMDTAYNADSSSGYEPLTSDEKEAMSDKEVEEWEKKIKDSLLRKDSILGNTSSAMKTNMLSAIEVNGKSYSLSSFGIATLNYFESADNEKGVFHIDGDKDDSSTSGNTDKLRAAIAEDPDTVIEFFSKLSQKVYSDLGKRMQRTSLSSALTIYNDKELAREYSDYKTKISDKAAQISTWEDYYYKKFSKMESALAAFNAQQSSLSGFFG